MKRLFYFLFIAIGLQSISIAQTKTTFNNADLKKGNMIRVPSIEVEFLNDEVNVMNDSLDLLVDFLQNHSNVKFEIACHTDSRGNLEGNLKASQYRAQGIRDHLVNVRGINPDMLTAKGYGESKLIISDEKISNAKTKEEKEMLNRVNRRIELVVLEIK